jgi:tetratricopeptide (TPR) repeat protein
MADKVIARWNQVKFQESAEHLNILPNLTEVQSEIRRVAFDINDRIRALQDLMGSGTNQGELSRLVNLRTTVRHAASVISSASTAIGREANDVNSDFGDCFPSEPSETMLRWMSSNTVFEVDEGSEEQSNATSVDTKRSAVAAAASSDNSDSDGDLEFELIQIHLARGKSELAKGNLDTAARLLQKCLFRIAESPLRTRHSRLRSSVLDLLLQAYLQQQKWDDAESLMKDKLAMRSRNASEDDIDVPDDMLKLSDILLQKRDYRQALLYARQALKAYRKAGEKGFEGVENALQKLENICLLDEDYDEQQAYVSMLDKFRRKRGKAPKIASNPQPSLAKAEPIHVPGSEIVSPEATVSTASTSSPSAETAPTPFSSVQTEPSAVAAVDRPRSDIMTELDPYVQPQTTSTEASVEIQEPV